MADTKNKLTAKRWFRWSLIGGGVMVVGLVVASGLFLWGLVYFGRNLPDYKQLASYEPPVTTRIHAGDGMLLEEYAREKRLFIPINAIPERLRQALVATEDKNFYTHNGLDYLGMIRANLSNVGNLISGKRLEGASTITQQVARNFLLTLDRRLDRKIKEMILALRIERALSKNQILELYLNEMYMGYGSYGVAAASLNYFNKALNELTLAEMAYLVALYKGPSNYHPVRRKERAIARRNWVLGRMAILGFITEEEKIAAQAEDLVAVPRVRTRRFRAEYFVEEVRRDLYAMYGENALYEGGLSVHTTLEPRYQAIAERVLRDGLVAYDRRHGWRGPVQTIKVTTDSWLDQLTGVSVPLGIPSWRLAVVLHIGETGAVIGLKSGRTGSIPFEEMTWARAWRSGQTLGGRVRSVTDVLTIGDVIAVEPIPEKPLEETGEGNEFDASAVAFLPPHALRQIPEVEGGIVVMDPHTGRVLAMVGGFDYGASQFNRATQAERQPGSAFKPFVYATALEAGFTPSSLVLDAPFVMEQGEGQAKWKPHNSSNRFYGPSTLRLGIEKSRNLMTVRLAQNIGMQPIVDLADRFGLGDNVIPTLSMALGAGEVTLIDLTAGYAMLVNGGKFIEPSLVDRIQDRRGRTLWRHDQRQCGTCNAAFEAGLAEPEFTDHRKQVIDPRTAYQVVSMLEGVVRNGTGRKIRVIGKPLAGKTGTTNQSFDTWFVGFSPDLAVGVFAGFDTPRSMGRGEEGSSVAVPIFRDFMKEALADTPAVPFRIPPGIRLVRVNSATGLPARKGDRSVIFEAFIPGTEPNGKRSVLDGSLQLVQTEDTSRRTTDGIY